jgi:hypothetical protein
MNNDQLIERLAGFDRYTDTHGFTRSSPMAQRAQRGSPPSSTS